MYISPITNQASNNQQTFQAVNMKYLERAKREIYWGKSITTDLLMCLRYDVILSRKISPEDGIDTLKAIKKLLGKEKDAFLETVISNFSVQKAREEKQNTKKSAK